MFVWGDYHYLLIVSLFTRSSLVSEIYMLSDKEYVVGRKDCDILLKDDPSISRKHAVLSVTFTESQVVSKGTGNHEILNRESKHFLLLVESNSDLPLES